VKVVVFEEPGRMTVRERPNPRPGGGAIVRVLGTGLCGTDLKIAHGELPARFPVILGHEVVGRVDAAAPGGAIPAGSRVVVDPAVSCGVCEVCRRDLPHLCPQGGLMGRDFDGGLAELIAIPEQRLHLIPAGVSFADAMLLQVLSTCVHAQSQLPALVGRSAVVVGLGAAGLLHVMLLAAAGAVPIIGIGRSPAKRDMAVELGATSAAAPADAPQMVAGLTDGSGADIVIESAGTPQTLMLAMQAAGAGGTVLIFGTTATADGLPVYDWYLKELTLLNSRAARPRDLSAAIRAVHSGLLHPGRLITARYALPDAAAAFEAAARPDQIKVTVTVADEPE
jgi:threonine dehydrogenase-like Zn-dependent dehydrogenase